MRLIDADAFKAYMRGALEQTRRCYPDGGEWAEAVTEEFCRDIDEQPTVQPDCKRAHWIISSDGYYPYCSECKSEPKNGEMTDSCPNCGADMWKENES